MMSIVNKEIIGKRIKELRKSKKMTSVELANLLGITQGALSTVESGRRGISIEVAKKLSEIFKVSTDYLVGNVDDPIPPSVLANEARLRTIPVYDSVSKEINERFPNENKIVQYTAIRVDSSGQYGVIIHGDSMEPEMSDGDIVIVDTRKEVLNGKKALIFWNNGILVRSIYRQDENVIFVSTNSKYSPNVIKSSEASKHILGSVIMLIKHYL